MATETNPFKLFSALYKDYQKKQPVESNAVLLSTASANGIPSSRVVLMKSFDEDGFVFYTNLDSEKGRQIKENPHAALCFYWEQISYQVRVNGKTEMVLDAEADEYFATRPQGSQIGAWASKQSSELKSREELLERVRLFQKNFESRDIPRPIFWSGFRVIPEKFEFWKRHEDRLHERTFFTRNNETWTTGLLYP